MCCRLFQSFEPHADYTSIEAYGSQLHWYLHHMRTHVVDTLAWYVFSKKSTVGQKEL